MALIKRNAEIKHIFNGVCSLDINEVITDAKNDELDNDILNKLNDIFEYVICYKSEYINQYNKLVSPSKVEENVFVIPRRYGVSNILNDITTDNRKPTFVERALISCNNIKNMRTKLETRLIKDLFIERNKIGGDKLLTDEQCRDIVALEDLMKKKLKDIFK